MKKLIVLILTAAIVEFLFVGVSKAQEPNAPKHEPNAPRFDPNMFRGRVVVVKDANGIITAVKLENRRRGTFNIVLDEKGKELGEKMVDKFVEITGTETTKNNEKWLTVEKYAEVKKAKEKGKQPKGKQSKSKQSKGK